MRILDVVHLKNSTLAKVSEAVGLTYAQGRTLSQRDISMLDDKIIDSISAYTGYSKEVLTTKTLQQLVADFDKSLNSK